MEIPFFASEFQVITAEWSVSRLQRMWAVEPDYTLTQMAGVKAPTPGDLRGR